MRLTPHRVMQTLRVGGMSAGVAAVIALAGPFKYEDLGLPFPDSVAHAVLFYGVTLAMLTSLPRARANEVAMIAVLLGGMSEVVQSVFGRSMSFQDFAGDCTGVAAAYVPIAITRLRELQRLHPHMTFAEIRAADRRTSRAIGARAATEQVPLS